MKKKLYILIILMIVIYATGCDMISSAVSTIAGMMNSELLRGGRIINTDYFAPKEIKSKNMISFSTKFFRYGEYDSSGDNTYMFKIEKEDSGKLVLTEDWCYDIKCEVDNTIFVSIQEIIDKYELVKLNGVEEYTQGLPTEFQPSYLEAVYDSGEKLYFYKNNEPLSPWTSEVLSCLGDVFIQNGYDEFRDPDGTKNITRFDFEYTKDDILYKYCEGIVPKPETLDKTIDDYSTYGDVDDGYYTVIMYSPWDRSGKSEMEDVWAQPSVEYYEELQNLIEKTDLKHYSNSEHFPIGFDYKKTPSYYSFYIEYEYGNTLYAFSSDTEKNIEFAPIAEQFSEYLNKYIIENQVLKYE